MKIRTLVKWLISHTHPDDEWDAGVDDVEKHLYHQHKPSQFVKAWDRVIEVKVVRRKKRK